MPPDLEREAPDPPATKRHTPGAAARLASAGLLVLAMVAVGVAITLTLGKPGDISIRDECTRSTLSTYLHAQSEATTDSLSGLNYGQLCNDDARHRMHIAFGAALALVALTAGATVLWTRSSGSHGSFA